MRYQGDVIEKVGPVSWVLIDTEQWYPRAGDLDRAFEVTYHVPGGYRIASGGRVAGRGKGGHVRAGGSGSPCAAAPTCRCSREEARMLQPVVISYLVLDLSDAGIGAMLRPVPGFALRRCASVQPELNRFLYTAVGGDWHWTDRLGWSYTQWDAVLSSPGYETWILFEEGSIAGYFELEARPSQVVELAYFGLLPFYVGRGLGAPLLEHAIARAKEKRAARMTVNTCTLDHARALANYLARGFVLVETRTVQKDVPEVPPGPWPGARSAAV